MTVHGEPVLNLDKAHIHAVEKDGARYRPDVDNVHAFSNILLMCRPHHHEIDGVNRDDYSADLLRSWKQLREEDGLAAFNGLNNLSEDRLEELISQSQEMVLERFDAAITRFEALDFETALLLRTLIEELSEARIRGIGVDRDAITLLSRSARSLYALPQTTELLSRTARKLQPLADTTNTLSKAAGSLAMLPESADVLDHAATILRGHGDSAVRLYRAAKIFQLLKLHEIAAELHNAAVEIRKAALTLEAAKRMRG
ncbi:hypothetical protein AB0K16_44165 [Nonomuraea jabiensis]|uniref:hypothetical protein n=1 Tax=Nonomuraea jabiensis TaxID=882448 RepID=UPI003446F5F5